VCGLCSKVLTILCGPLPIEYILNTVGWWLFHGIIFFLHFFIESDNYEWDLYGRHTTLFNSPNGKHHHVIFFPLFQLFLWHNLNFIWQKHAIFPLSFISSLCGLFLLYCFTCYCIVHKRSNNVRVMDWNME
jgi:hypothetical protein